MELIVLNELRYMAFGNWLLLPSSRLTTSVAILYSLASVCITKTLLNQLALSSMSHLSEYIKI